MGAVSSASNRPPAAQAGLPVPNGVSTQQHHQSYQRLGHNTDMHISRRSPYSTGPDGVARPNPPEVPLAEYSTTRTIRSQCNLRRDSVQITPVPGQPFEYDFTFLFDCGADTSVSVHFLACDRMQVHSRVTPRCSHACSSAACPRTLSNRHCASPPHACPGARHPANRQLLPRPSPAVAAAQPRTEAEVLSPG